MFCENCGKEMPDDATFCPHCGGGMGKNAVKTVKNEKNMIIALIISFLLTGLGIFYAGNKKKGILLFIAGLIFYILGRAIPICTIIGVLIWAYGLYDTYNQVKIANGESNPNILNDFKHMTTPKKIGAIVLALLVLLAVAGSVMLAFSPNTHTSNTNNLDTSSSDFSTSSSSSDSSSSADSSDSSHSSSSDSSDSSDDTYSSSVTTSDGESYTASSDGKNSYSHYEGEYGSSDTYGTVNNDGSVDAHQTGHTDYGDYEIDSHMDSDGNIHGTVDVGGKTYEVNT